MKYWLADLQRDVLLAVFNQQNYFSHHLNAFIRSLFNLYWAVWKFNFLLATDFGTKNYNDVHHFIIN